MRMILWDRRGKSYARKCVCLFDFCREHIRDFCPGRRLRLHSRTPLFREQSICFGCNLHNVRELPERSRVESFIRLHGTSVKHVFCKTCKSWQSVFEFSWVFTGFWYLILFTKHSRQCICRVYPLTRFSGPEVVILALKNVHAYWHLACGAVMHA